MDHHLGLLKAVDLAIDEPAATVAPDSHPEPRDQHILIVEDNQGQRKIDLHGSIYSVGRNPDCDISLVSQFASRHHATFLYMPFSEREDCCYCIVDGNIKGQSSTNGLFINGRKMKARDLRDGDEIIFGPDARASYHRLTFSAEPTVPGGLDETITADIFDCLQTDDAESIA
ncbi:MAG: FHA domain-containing protein [Leptolyngbya sp. RL_3_1]|nr:FHA domain-containing protein [Leptolyngbya sp. RL_3_1]